MLTKVSRRAILLGVAAPLAALVVGCYGPDNPKMVEAPPPTPPATPPEQPKIPGAREDKPAYGSGSVYQKAMQRQGERTGL